MKARLPSSEIFRTPALYEQSGALYFTNPDPDDDTVKTILKRSPRLYETLIYATSTIYFYGMSAERAIKRAFGNDTSGKLIVNLGSGTSNFGSNVINVDAYPFPDVTIVARAENLPFKDGAVDMIISESMLEHAMDPDRAIAEIRRVVRSGGYVYLELPFMYPYHASPRDYTRFTIEGLAVRFGDEFVVERAGARSGPIAALVIQVMYIGALLLSLGSSKLYSGLLKIFMVILSPLKILDIFCAPFYRSHEAASHIYFFARKRS